MRTIIRTTIIRDRDGYEVRDYGNPAPAKGATILGGPPSGVHIIGKAGVNEMIPISTAANLRLWKKARQLDSVHDVTTFMDSWGQLSRGLRDDGSRPYRESFLLVEPHLQDLKKLANFVEAGDRQGFCLSLNNHVLLSRANIAIDVADAPESPE